MSELPDHLQGLGGGELAGALSPQIKADMISKGYNILSEADARRYYAGQPSEKSIHIAAGVGTVNTMGEGHMNYQKDYAAIKRELGDDVPFDEDDINDLGSLGNTKPVSHQSVAQRMENYGGGSGKVDAKVRTLLDSREQPQQQQRQSTRGPLQIPKKIVEKQLITEAKQAKQFGYNYGVKYLNAFINLLKQPSSANRENLLIELNNMVLTEEKIHPNLLPTYRQGVAIAEAELYNKIKSNKK